MSLRPLELARPIVLVALVVSVAAASSRASVPAQQWPERRGQGPCDTQLGFNPHPPPVSTLIK